MNKLNFTIGAFTFPFIEAFIEENDEIVPNFKSIKQFASMFTDYGQLRLKFVLPETGQLGVLTEIGYHDGALGLMQDDKIDGFLLPIPLDTQRAPGCFTPVISDEHYYIVSIRNTNHNIANVLSSLASINLIPILVAGLTTLIVEMATFSKHLNCESMVNVICQSIGIFFHQHLSYRLSWYRLIQMIILMFPIFMFNASFNTQTIVGNSEPKIETLRDIVDYDKTPVFIEGLSMYDLFKAQVTRVYRAVYQHAKSKGIDKPFELGIIPDLKFEPSKVVALISGSVKMFIYLPSEYIKSNQEIYFSEKPFHNTLKALLLSKKVSTIIKKRLYKLILKASQTGILKKLEARGYEDFTLSLNIISIFDLNKADSLRKSNDVNWKSLNWDGYKETFYAFIGSLMATTILQLFELLIYSIHKRTTSCI